jgi:hypothetical protein
LKHYSTSSGCPNGRCILQQHHRSGAFSREFLPSPSQPLRTPPPLAHPPACLLRRPRPISASHPPSPTRRSSTTMAGRDGRRAAPQIRRVPRMTTCPLPRVHARRPDGGGARFASPRSIRSAAGLDSDGGQRRSTGSARRRACSFFLVLRQRSWGGACGGPQVR